MISSAGASSNRCSLESRIAARRKPYSAVSARDTLQRRASRLANQRRDLLLPALGVSVDLALHVLEIGDVRILRQLVRRVEHVGNVRVRLGIYVRRTRAERPVVLLV